MIVLPQFDRPSHWPKPGRPPRGREWDVLKEMGETALLEMGLSVWDRRDGQVLMLFPAEWWVNIPEGHLVTDIFFMTYKFVRAKEDDDTRCGFLGFGVLTKESEQNAKQQ